MPTSQHAQTQLAAICRRRKAGLKSDAAVEGRLEKAADAQTVRISLTAPDETLKRREHASSLAAGQWSSRREGAVVQGPTAPGIADRGAGVASPREEAARRQLEPAIKAQGAVMTVQLHNTGAGASSEERPVGDVLGARGEGHLTGSQGVMLLPGSETLRGTSTPSQCPREAATTTGVHGTVETATEPPGHRGKRMFARPFPFVQIDALLTGQSRFHRLMMSRLPGSADVTTLDLQVGMQPPVMFTTVF